MGQPLRVMLSAVVAILWGAAADGRLIVQRPLRELPGRAGECFIMQPLDGGAGQVSNPAECRDKRSPASTFKIPHALIALEAGVINSSSVMKWDGTTQNFPAWQRDHSLDSAMKSSVLWFFRRTAAAIGRDRMAHWLRKLSYGDDSFAGELTSFWVNGDLVISPEQQVEFLARMFRHELPVARAHVDAVATALVMPHGQILNAAGAHSFATRWPAGAELRAKTGNTGVANQRVSWLVGHIETSGGGYVFAARARAAGALDTTAGAEVARRHLAVLPK